jgi:hypothetical protein
LSLAEARTRGLIGSSAAAIIFALSFAYHSGGNTASSGLTPLGVVVGLLGLLGLFGIVGAMESISKSFSNRFVVDTYVLALALGFAASAVSEMLGLVGQPSLVPSFGSVGAGLVDGLPVLGFAELFGFLVAEAALLFLCFYRIARLTNNRLFVLAGTVYGVNAISRDLLTTSLLSFGSIILFISFLKTRPEAASQGSKLSWNDVPKGRLGALSSIWFTEDGIFKVRPILASVTLLVFACLYSVSFVGQTIFQRYDVNGNLSPETTTQIVFQDAGVFVVIVAFILLSRYRYPRFSEDEVTRRANRRISWDGVTKIEPKVRTARGGRWTVGVTLEANPPGASYPETYPIVVDRRLMGALNELVQRKLGRTLLTEEKKSGRQPTSHRFGEKDPLDSLKRIPLSPTLSWICTVNRVGLAGPT